MKPFVKYIKQLDADKELLSIYRELREEFQKEGWTEKDLEKPPYYTRNIMSLFEMFGRERSRLINELKTFFSDIDIEEFTDYIQHSMIKINKETPLPEVRIEKTKNDGD